MKDARTHRLPAIINDPILVLDAQRRFIGIQMRRANIMRKGPKRTRILLELKGRLQQLMRDSNRIIGL